MNEALHLLTERKFKRGDLGGRRVHKDKPDKPQTQALILRDISAERNLDCTLDILAKKTCCLCAFNLYDSY